MHLVGLASKEERAVTAFDDGNLMSSEEAIYRSLIDRILLLELIDGEAINAASGRPRSAT
jgi:hypothetical protein